MYMLTKQRLFWQMTLPQIQGSTAHCYTVLLIQKALFNYCMSQDKHNKGLFTILMSHFGGKIQYDNSML